MWECVAITTIVKLIARVNQRLAVTDIIRLNLTILHPDQSGLGLGLGLGVHIIAAFEGGYFTELVCPAELNPCAYAAAAPAQNHPVEPVGKFLNFHSDRGCFGSGLALIDEAHKVLDAQKHMFKEL